jgi:hypothetical protein
MELFNTPLLPAQVREFRGQVGLIMYLAHDRPDVQFAAKEAARRMSAPLQYDSLRIKRIARYFLGKPVLELVFEEEKPPLSIDVPVDSDFAGDTESRKSTSGGFILLGHSVIASWSRTQATVSLSSGEAEYIALATGATEARQVQTILQELGHDSRITLLSDSSAARGAAETLGLRKMKHLQIRVLFLKELVSSGALSLVRIRGGANPADMLTKPVNTRVLQSCMGLVGLG